MSTITRITLKARQRLIDQLHDERGVSVEAAIIIGLGITLALALVAAVTGAFDGYISKIR